MSVSNTYDAPGIGAFSWPGLPSQSEIVKSPETMYPGWTPPPAQTGMYSDMPGSAQELISRATDEGGGGGHSQAYVTRNTTLRPWASGKFSWMTDVLEGQLLFSLTTQAEDTDELALLNLFNMNQLLSRGYDTALEAVEGPEFNDEEKRILTERPTWQWNTIPAIEKKLRYARKDSSVSSIRYLCPELFFNRFEIAGWIEGTQTDFSSVQQRALRQYGLIDNCENKYYADLKPAESLYLILKRTYNKTERRYGHYAFHPWAGNGYPEDSDVKYKDNTGHSRDGQVIYIGELNQWVDNEPVFDDEIAVTTGLTDATKEQLPQTVSRCLRITAQCQGWSGMRFSLF